MATQMGADADHPSAEETQTSDDAALVPFVAPGLPSPRELLARIIEGIDEGVLAMRKGRSVTCPEDTHAVIRQVAAWYITADEYATVFAGVKSHCEGVSEDELMEGVGPKRGTEHVPARSMTVPHEGMNITVMPVFTSDADVDMNAVLNALAVEVADRYEVMGTEEMPFLSWSQAISLAVEVAEEFLALHRKTVPSVTAVKALAAQAGARGHDDVAAAVNSAVKPTRREYRDKVKLDIKPAA